LLDETTVKMIDEGLHDDDCIDWVTAFSGRFDPPIEGTTT
jgi:hypothetical protein